MAAVFSLPPEDTLSSLEFSKHNKPTEKHHLGYFHSLLADEEEQYISDLLLKENHVLRNYEDQELFPKDSYNLQTVFLIVLPFQYVTAH